MQRLSCAKDSNNDTATNTLGAFACSQHDALFSEYHYLIHPMPSKEISSFAFTFALGTHVRIVIPEASSPSFLCLGSSLGGLVAMRLPDKTTGREEGEGGEEEGKRREDPFAAGDRF